MNHCFYLTSLEQHMLVLFLFGSVEAIEKSDRTNVTYTRLVISHFVYILCPTDKDSNDSTVPSGFEDNDELQNHGKALWIFV